MARANTHFEAWYNTLTEEQQLENTLDTIAEAMRKTAMEIAIERGEYGIATEFMQMSAAEILPESIRLDDPAEDASAEAAPETVPNAAGYGIMGAVIATACYKLGGMIGGLYRKIRYKGGAV